MKLDEEIELPIERELIDLKFRIERLDDIKNGLLVWIEGEVMSWNAQWFRTQVEKVIDNMFIHIVFVDAKIDSAHNSLVPGLTNFYEEEMALFTAILIHVKKYDGTVAFVSTGAFRQFMEETGLPVIIILSF